MDTRFGHIDSTKRGDGVLMNSLDGPCEFQDLANHFGLSAIHAGVTIIKVDLFIGIITSRLWVTTYFLANKSLACRHQKELGFLGILCAM